MSREFVRRGKDEIAREIISYLKDHAAASDTLEGIVQWWLLERKIQFEIELVKETISELLLKEFIIEDSIENSVVCYRINKNKGKKN